MLSVWVNNSFKFICLTFLCKLCLYVLSCAAISLRGSIFMDKLKDGTDRYSYPMRTNHEIASISEIKFSLVNIFLSSIAFCLIRLVPSLPYGCRLEYMENCVFAESSRHTNRIVKHFDEKVLLSESSSAYLQKHVWNCACTLCAQI